MKGKEMNTEETRIIIHRASERGFADHGWLKSFHSFSFASYYNPEKMSFGALRVLNDDTVALGMGFGAHPHHDMEIISIPLEGELEHNDSMGNTTVISKGEVQIMSAGTGVQHSEYNKSKTEEVKFLQIWVFPREKSLKPVYGQVKIDRPVEGSEFQMIVSPEGGENVLQIHQDAWFHFAYPEKGRKIIYTKKKMINGVYFFVLDGEATIAGENIRKRDATGIIGTDQTEIFANENSRILIIEVPMEIN